MHPATATYSWRLADFPALQPAEIAFRSANGALLHGRFFRGDNGATVLLSHGYGGTQDEMLPVADALGSAGFNVFTYDLRGCGRSGGSVTFGASETEDLVSAVDYVSSRLDIDGSRIGALGFSMGAATTVMAAARDERIRAVVDDSGWADAHSWLKPRASQIFLHPSAPFAPLSLRLVELRTKVRLTELRPVDVIEQIGPRPILIVHGQSDTVVDPADAERNFAAALEPKTLRQFLGARHGDTIALVAPAYAEQVVTFFQRSLGSR